MGDQRRPGRRERRAQKQWAREMERRLAELDRLDAHYGLGASPYSPPPPRRGGLTSRSTVPAAIVAALLVGIVFALLPAAAPLRALLGFGEQYGDRPAYTEGSGTYAFLATQDGSDEPVGYDPCETIRIEINPDGAPDDHRELVDTALERISGATGLDLEVVGETDESDAANHGDGYVGSPPPVLVAWLTEEDEPDLAGDVAGIGGSSSVRVAGRWRFTTGIVVLDREDFADIEDAPNGDAQRQAIVDHEFGHLVGLGHVDDPNELMYAENTNQTTFGPGDLEGLGRLGAIPCG